MTLTDSNLSNSLICTAVFGEIRVRLFLFIAVGFIQMIDLKQTHCKYAYCTAITSFVRFVCAALWAFAPDIVSVCKAARRALCDVA